MSRLDRYSSVMVLDALSLLAEREEEGRPLTLDEMAGILGRGGSGDYAAIRAGMIDCGWLRVVTPAAGPRPMLVALTDAGWASLGRPRPKSTAARRTCLTCFRPFASTWAGNRICPACAPAVERRQSCMA